MDDNFNNNSSNNKENKMNKYRFKNARAKKMIYACYFILNPKKESCTTAEIQAFIKLRCSDG